jgi:uncharacterized protein YbdZ (MbtH family)
VFPTDEKWKVLRPQGGQATILVRRSHFQQINTRAGDHNSLEEYETVPAGWDETVPDGWNEGGLEEVPAGWTSSSYE